ncbi:hypothetical protein, partial [Bifidobacterium aquikefiri]|uniref:hypothetical protein n=1 Tax=Bifidobacterium aquikefiri TaxID=1653207 RepID=UPI0039E77276
ACKGEISRLAALARDDKGRGDGRGDKEGDWVGVTRKADSVEMTREMGMAGIDIGLFLLSWLCCDA